MQVQKYDSSCSGLMSPHVKNLVHQRAGGLNSDKCLQDTVRHGGGSLIVCISENGDLVRIIVFSLLRNTGRYVPIMQHDEGGVKHTKIVSVKKNREFQM